MIINWSSEWYEPGNGLKQRLVLNTSDEGEICNFAEKMSRVLTKVCGYDDMELEEEWMDYSCDKMMGPPTAEGCERWFDKYAKEVLEQLWQLEPSAFDIFENVEEEKVEELYYGSGDDGFASAMFPTD